MRKTYPRHKFKKTRQRSVKNIWEACVTGQGGPAWKKKDHEAEVIGDVSASRN